MTWLKAAGKIALLVGKFVVGVQQMIPPGVIGTLQTVESVLARVLQVIVDVEAMGATLALTGPQKLQAAVAAGTNIFLRWSASMGHKIAPERQSLFTQGVTQVVDGLVKIANSWKSDTIETKNTD